MDIFIVGNITKDVYLSVDPRTEALEADRHGVKWLSLSFDASKHRFFHRVSIFGGASVSEEIFTKMGLTAKITNSDDPRYVYRYIFTADDNVSYFAPTDYTSAIFTTPSEPIKYLYIDRSANLNDQNLVKVQNYLRDHPDTRLVIYLKDYNNPGLNTLARSADLIFTEREHALPAHLPHDKIVYIAEHSLSYQNITEPISRDRIDKLTHLSAYSIASATILSGFILGKTVERSLRLARTNLENSTLDSCLSLNELESIAATQF